MTRVLRAIGLICGTSMDAVDVSLIESDGKTLSCWGKGAGGLE